MVVHRNRAHRMTLYAPAYANGLPMVPAAPFATVYTWQQGLMERKWLVVSHTGKELWLNVQQWAIDRADNEAPPERAFVQLSLF